MAERTPDGHQRSIERWIADIRAAAVAFALLEVGLLTESYPPGYERWAWALTAVFAAGAAVFLVITRRGTNLHARAVGIAALAFDTLVIGGFAVLYSFEYGSPTRWALVFPVVEAALRYGLPGAIAFGLALVPVFAFLEWWRADRFGPPPFVTDRVSFPSGMMLIVGAIVGTLVTTLRREMARAEERADEAELLRDELGRRADLLDAASRVARAIGSSLDFDEAFTAFSRELRGLVPCERLAIVVVENDAARVLAAGGDEASRALPTGTAVPLAGSLAEEVVRRAQTVYRPDMIEPRFDEEPALTAVGIRSRVGAPLLLGPRAIGILSFSRREPDGFDEREIELVALIGRLVATAVQNIRSHEAERRTVDELRRLSALRADFVSLVSHELRSPMASVIGSARTLQARWRELTPEQRDAFIALIADETNRLATLVGDVLDTSRIDAGTFTYSFEDVDVGALVTEAVAAATVAQDEVPVVARVADGIPRVRGDRERLRQVLANLIDNAVKHSPHGVPVEVRAHSLDGHVRVDVADEGPGVHPADRRLIFEKFGRAGGGAKPGTGLGLYIARSIAEAHGGTLDVEPTPRGATFALALPLRRS